MKYTGSYSIGSRAVSFVNMVRLRPPVICTYKYVLWNCCKKTSHVQNNMGCAYFELKKCLMWKSLAAIYKANIEANVKEIINLNHNLISVISRS